MILTKQPIITLFCSETLEVRLVIPARFNLYQPFDNHCLVLRIFAKTLSMKKIFTILLVAGATTFGFSQSIQSFQVKPASPTVNDTIEICWTLQFPTSSCAGTCTWNQNGFNIQAGALHCIGSLQAICTDVDTVVLYPPHTAGTYSCTFVLSSGAAPAPCTPGITPNDQRTINFNVSTVTGTGTGNQFAPEVQLAPNPASSNVVLNLGKYQVTDNIIVTTLAGKKAPAPFVYTGSKISFDVSKLKAGIYMVNVPVDGGTIVRRLVVTH